MFKVEEYLDNARK